MKSRKEREVKGLVSSVLAEWDINDYYVMILGETGSTIYPDRHILTLGREQLDWPEPAVVSSILHEVGHIEMGHYLGEHNDALLNYLDEYEADEFAWDALRTRYGYVPDSAGLWLLKAYGTWMWDMDLFTHPSYEHRWQRLAWNGFVPEDCRTILQALGLGKVEA